MKWITFFVSGLLVSLGLSSPVHAQDKQAHAAHSHGAGLLELSVLAGKVSGRFDIPMESLLGHEHLPRTDAQKKAMAHLQTALASVDYLMTLPPAA